ncbi:Uncharacterized protein conserved in bacteria [Mycoplasmopsis citelli]|uniref:Uncharacterized protein conserved in bacteria n=1 Tax=Mycoplasmopsis citelli TaxID=171281 RepID=A0A449B1V7_9BACT|nr:DNA-binding protein WhiA [Mycoplasmopsis citelli]VEU74551.1 Uncharacterized protein conserved in bacteria [Mycoplasmopsis citelli]
MKTSSTNEIKREIIKAKKIKEIQAFLLGLLIVNSPTLQVYDEKIFEIKSIQLQKEIIRMCKKLKIKFVIPQNSSKKIIITEHKLLFPELESLQWDDVAIDSGNTDLSKFFAGVFFAGGTISNLNSKSYFLYISAKNKDNLLKIQEILNQYEFDFKYQFKKNKHTIYIRSIDLIIEFLSAIEAKKAYFEYLDLKIKRDMYSMVNRINNLDFANLKKIASTSINYVELINYVYEHNLEEKFSDNELVFHRIRLENPGLSLTYIVNILQSEHNIFITKAGLNHWNRKLKKVVLAHQKLNQ